MTYLAFALLLGAAGAPPADDAMVVAKRLTTAIQGRAEFQDADFVRPLQASDKAALRRFGPCKVEEIGYTLKADPTERDAYITDRDRVLVRLGCKGVPSSTPVGLQLHLQNGRIGTIETHNADLMKAD